MNCPACQSALATHKYHRLTIDRCPECEGLWFDPGELKEFIEDLLIEFHDIPEARIEPSKKIIKLHEIAEKGRSCPRCRTTMEKVNFAYDSNIVVDRCRACGGVWVDGGEIEAIASHVKGNPKLREMAYSMLEDRKEIPQQIDKALSVLVNILYLLGGVL